MNIVTRRFANRFQYFICIEDTLLRETYQGHLPSSDHMIIRVEFLRPNNYTIHSMNSRIEHHVIDLQSSSSSTDGVVQQQVQNILSSMDVPPNAVEYFVPRIASAALGLAIQHDFEVSKSFMFLYL